MDDDFKEKIEKLSSFSMYVGNTDNKNLIGVAEVVLEFTREDILKVCDELYSFVIYGLAKSNKTKEIIDFIEEFRTGKFQYKNGTTSTIRFIHFSNYYMEKFFSGFEKTPFEIGNVFVEAQIK